MALLGYVPHGLTSPTVGCTAHPPSPENTTQQQQQQQQQRLPDGPINHSALLYSGAQPPQPPAVVVAKLAAAGHAATTAPPATIEQPSLRRPVAITSSSSSSSAAILATTTTNNNNNNNGQSTDSHVTSNSGARPVMSDTESGYKHQQRAQMGSSTGPSDGLEVQWVSAFKTCVQREAPTCPAHTLALVWYSLGRLRVLPDAQLLQVRVCLSCWQLRVWERGGGTTWATTECLLD
jgi:hypothetical protein